MNISEFQRNRAELASTLVSQYQGRWVALSADGTKVIASGQSLDQVESQLSSLEADPQGVFFEYIAGPEEDIIFGGGNVQ